MSESSDSRAPRTSAASERTPQWGGVIDVYVRAGRLHEAAEMLEAVDRYADAGWVLLGALPRRSTPSHQLTPDERKAALRAAENFDRSGNGYLACGLLVNVGEGARAAQMLRKAGRLADAADVEKGYSLPTSPWPDGMLFALNPVTGRQFEAAAAPAPRRVSTAEFRHPEPDPFETDPDLPSAPETPGRPAKPVTRLEAPPPPAPAPSADRTPRDVDASLDVEAELDAAIDEELRLDRGRRTVETSHDPEDELVMELSSRFVELVSEIEVDEEEPEEEEAPAAPPLPPVRVISSSSSSRLSGSASASAGTGSDLSRSTALGEGGLDPDLVGPGDVLAERYRIERLLGAGATARVFAATDLDLEESVALKLFAQRANDRKAVRRFRREIKLSRRLSHPNITRIFEFGVRHGLRFITMELHVGSDLKHHLAEAGGRLLPDEATLLMAQAASGLQAAHDEGVVHRDIKPSNLYVLAEGRRLKIMDFGFAKIAGGVTDGRTRVGSPRYMSPEAMRGDVDTGPPSDLYSLGVVFYEIVTGSRTAEGDAGIAGLLKASLGALPPPPHELDKKIPLDLSDIVMRLLAKAPEDRFSSARKLQQALLSSSAVRGYRR